MTSGAKTKFEHPGWISEEDMDDDDGDCEFYLKPELPVADLKGLDLSRPPANGAEYLATVRLEAQRYPDVVTVDVDIPNYLSDSEPIEKPFEEFLKADPSICPESDWQTEMVQQFKSLRAQVASMIIELKKHNTKQASLPKASNISLWRKTVVGEVDHELPVSQENILDNDSDEDDDIKLLCPANSGLMPRLSVLALMSQSLIVDILEGLVDWIRDEGFSHRFGLWTYSLLACLEEPLHGDYVDILRKLSRVCSLIRSKHDRIPDKSLITSLNLIICIIGKYFNQKDLTD